MSSGRAQPRGAQFLASPTGDRPRPRARAPPAVALRSGYENAGPAPPGATKPAAGDHRGLEDVAHAHGAGPVLFEEAVRPLAPTPRLCAPSGNNQFLPEGGAYGEWAGRFLRSPSPADRPCSPLVWGHDGHGRRYCHPGWRGPQALPALQSELRPNGQDPRPPWRKPLPGCDVPCWRSNWR
ncbi:hypothetical protein P7K49_011751 [Saguinus oedipus]|uniref:Uncharacterized protein n=1 Tax=Saguinus oedipus TaxID=9490 RepID=A0ABQ9VRK2_SAGOE|nr:hypothetical protein P7K49_011751 [Saguinus oedipus]